MIKLYKAIGKDKAADDRQIQAITRTGIRINDLVDAMAEVVSDQYQTTIKAGEQVKTLQLENVAHMKGLDERLIKNLKGGTYTGVDYAQAQAEVLLMENELMTVDNELAKYESKMNEYKAKADWAKVTEVSKKMGEILDVKHGILDGRLMADGLVSDIRAKILDSAEGVQSAKGALAASSVSYLSLNALADSLKELEIKYKHAQEDMIPTFKIQGRTATLQMIARDVRNTLVEVAGASEKLMMINANLAASIGQLTFDLLKTPVYDVNKAKEIRNTLYDKMAQLNENKMQWAAETQKFEEAKSQMPGGSHYAKQK
jgi:signal recognition particle subunit SEC65